MKLFLIVLTIFLNVFIVSAQDVIKQKLATYHYLTHPEKLFIATNCAVYNCGDTLWYSSWLLNAGNLSPEKLETILEVRLVNSQNGKSIIKQLVPIENGRSKGQMLLPLGLESGTYQLTGNTNYMRNQGSVFFFSKTIYIQSNFNSIDPLSTPVIENNPPTEIKSEPEKTTLPIASKSSELSELTIDFLPEGGNWIANVPSRMAFYGTMPGTDTIIFSGIIYDNDNNITAFIKPEFRGRGSVNITPLPGKQYHAIITDAKGFEFKVDLPSTDQTSTYTLSVNNRWNSAQLTVNICKSPSFNTADSLKLVVVQHGAAAMQHYFSPKGVMNSFSIEKALLKTGIAQITLFDKNNSPLSERLVFINNNDFTEWEANIKTKNDSIILDIKSKDKLNHPLKGDYAVSVCKIENKLDTLIKSPDIVQYLYLHSDLPGLESDCAYFFKNDTKSSYCADLTMLTNGWRRYKWDQVLVDSIPTLPYLLEQKFYISGIVKREGNDKPVKDGIELTLMGNGEDLIAGSAKTNEMGAFYFPIDFFNYSSNFIVQTKNRLKLNANYNIELKTNLLNYSEMDDYASRISVANKYAADDTSIVTPQKVKYEVRVQPIRKTHPPLPETWFMNTTDVNISEVTVKEKLIFSPMERLHNKYGSPSLVVGAKQLAKIDQDNTWNSGLISIINRMIPGLDCRRKFNEARHSMDGLKVCNCLPIEIEAKDSDECYEFAYKGQSKLRFFIYVDGELCAFTNHAGQVDWAKDQLFTMDVLLIDNIGFIEYPKEDAVMDALAVFKREHEFYCSATIASHIINNCLVGFDVAPSRIISIKTKSGFGIQSSVNNNGIASTRLSGYTPAKEFYVPKYSKNSMADLIQFKTIYWNPSAQTNDEGLIHLDLNPADSTVDYVLAINGMNSNNEPGSYFRIIKNDIVNTSQLSSDITEQSVAPLPKEEPGLLQILTVDNKPCYFALVWSKSGKLKQQTALAGQISIDLGSLSSDDSIFVSVPNYGNTALTVEDVITANHKIHVTYQVLSDEKMVFKKSIIAEVNKQNVKNLSLTPYYIEGVFREQLQLNGFLTSLTDLSFVQRKAAYKDQVYDYSTMIKKAHQFKQVNYKEKVPFELKYRQSDFVPNIDVHNMALGFLLRESENCYTYSFIGHQLFNGRPTSIFSFTPKKDDPVALYSGILLVDDETKALAHVQWHVYESRMHLLTYNSFMAPLRNEPVFKLINDQHHVTYCLKNDKWKLLSASGQYQWLYGGKPYQLQSELIITHWLNNKAPGFKKSIPYDVNEGKRTVKQTMDYCPSEWRQGDVMIPNKQIIEQVKSLQEEIIWK